MNAAEQVTMREPLAAPFDMTSVAIAVLDGDGLVVGWTSAAQSVLGYRSAEVLRRPAARLLVDERYGRHLAATMRKGTGKAWAGIALLRHRDGRPLQAGVWTWPLLDGPGGQCWWLVAAVVIGETPWWEVNRSMLDRLLARSPVGIAVMSQDLRYLWINDALERSGGVPRPDRLGKRLGEVLPGLNSRRIEARMREVLTSGQPLLDYEYRGRTQADPQREHAYSTSFFRLDDVTGRVLGVCYMVVDVTDRWRARERLALLNEVGARTGSTLDVVQTAQELARIGVPRLADFVTVDLLDWVLAGGLPRMGGPPGRQVVRRAGQQSILEGCPESIARPGQTVGFPGSPGERCLSDGTSRLEAVPDLATREWIAADSRRREKLRAFGLRSLMLVPIRARGNTLGVATFVRWLRPEPFEQDDLTLAEDVVARAAVNVDNARQFAREHNTALTLQRNLLPHRLAGRTTVDVASCYMPAEASGGVGGDWFDVIPLSGARTALVVGDVVGHGINAAATMGRLRTAVRTLADMDLSPEEVLAHLDDLILDSVAEDAADTADTADAAGDMAEQASAAFGATCLYAVYDPVTRTCRMARAGHVPPAIVSPDGAVTFPDLPAGPPLGLGGMPFESAECRLEAGSLLALYTDGLVQARDRDMEAGLDRLRAALARPDDPLDRLCATVLDSLADEPPEDDIALLLARTHPLDADSVASWYLPCDPAVVADARALAARRLSEWGLEGLSSTTELIVSELVTNAIRYGCGPIWLRLIRQAALICEVSDASSTSPRLRHARATDEGGRGLYLVAQLARRWGTRYTDSGKIIWAEHELPAALTAAGDLSRRPAGYPVP